MILSIILLYLLPQSLFHPPVLASHVAFQSDWSHRQQQQQQQQRRPQYRSLLPNVPNGLFQSNNSNNNQDISKESDELDRGHTYNVNPAETRKKRSTVSSSRRFVQKVHPSIISQVEKQQQQQQMQQQQMQQQFQKQQDEEKRQARTNKKQLSKAQNTRKSDPKSTSPPIDDSSYIDKFVLSKHKSLEELEQTMIQRWGTRLDRWTKDDQQHKSKSSTTDKVSLDLVEEEIPKIQSKPVLNPWDIEEQRIKQRGRKNKESTLHDQLNIYFDSREYYDEDDEGYEPRTSLNNDVKNININRTTNQRDDESKSIQWNDDIIRPSPIGGQGRERKQHKVDTKVPEQHKVVGESNTLTNFFFRPPTDTSSTINASSHHHETTQNQKRFSVHGNKNSLTDHTLQLKKQQQQPLLRPIARDVNDREMYLTLDQAKREAQDFLANDPIRQSSHNDYSSVENYYQQKQIQWRDVGITHTTLVDNLIQMKCHQPLPVQVKSCTSILCGTDVLISTYTGSGKTLSFLTPLAQRILFHQKSMNDDDVDDVDDNDDFPLKDATTGVQAIIITPGRELASQTLAVAKELLKGTGVQVVLAIGGTPFTRNWEQIRTKKPQILIGTPGRIAELIVGKPDEKGGKLKISSIESLVLDECDALLEYEAHREPTTSVIDMLRKRHGDLLQSILCSATADDLLIHKSSSIDPSPTTRRIDRYLRLGYAHIQADDNDTWITGSRSGVTRVSRTAIHGSVHIQHQRFALDTLRKILNTEPIPQQVLVFVDNARRVGIVVEKLANMGIIAAPLHGGAGSDKGERSEVNKLLREGYVGLVVATEMAARGIDAPFLTHVINLDLPTDVSHYAHRAGRCGRGGRPGVVINITVGPPMEKVPHKFAKALNIKMHSVEPRAGKLVILGE